MAETMTDATTATLSLNSGAHIPQLGLGVWQTPAGATARQAVLAALQLGYRHVDTARIYGNEADVGAAVRSGAVPREQVFVTTKLWNDDHGYDKALRAFDASLKRLGVDYVDLYLLHWPVAGKRLDSWRALERLYEEKRARSIGVSNFLVPHLKELLGAAKHVPAVNQIELTPFLQRRDTVALCREHGIVVEAYSPLTHGERLDHPLLEDVARRVGRTVAQVLLRWSLQHGNVVLPKSTKPERIAENARLFDFALDERAMAALDALEEGLVTGWDPEDQR
jgi:diketogulonate reductase-like aldo/keto reductase